MYPWMFYSDLHYTCLGSKRNLLLFSPMWRKYHFLGCGPNIPPIALGDPEFEYYWREKHTDTYPSRILFCTCTLQFHKPLPRPLISPGPIIHNMKCKQAYSRESTCWWLIPDPLPPLAVCVIATSCKKTTCTRSLIWLIVIPDFLGVPIMHIATHTFVQCRRYLNVCMKADTASPLSMCI